MATTRYDFELRAGPFQESDLSVTRFVGTEAMSRLTVLEVDFFPVSGERLDQGELNGAEARLLVRRAGGEERFFQGVISAARLLTKAGKPRYRAVVLPRLSLLELSRQSRTFLDLTVPEVVKQVLDSAGIAQRWSLAGTYPKRECTAQYQESDLCFVMRLLERQGIFFFFEQRAEGEVMVIADGPHAFEDLADPLPFRRKEAAAHGYEEHIYELACHSRRVPKAVVLRDYDFERPALDVTGETDVGAGFKPALADAEVYEYPAGCVQASEAKRLSRIRLEELRFGAETWAGMGDTPRLGPGRLFEVFDHPIDAWNGKRLAVTVTHHGRQASVGAGFKPALLYESGFLAIDAARPYRPLRRTPSPSIKGFQTATVVGPATEEIHTDAHGRLRLEHHWAGSSGERPKSAWVRVAQSVAGPGFGAFYLPRIGQEVVVAYEGGDPERPMVIGAVYNGAHGPSANLPRDKTQTVLTTDTSPYDGGYNEVRFEDAAGLEKVSIHARKDETIEVLHDKEQRVGGSENLLVGKDRTQAVSGSQSLRVKWDDLAEVDGNEALTVKGDREVMVCECQAEGVGAAQTIIVKGNERLHVSRGAQTRVGGVADLNVGTGYLVNVALEQSTSVDGDRLEDVRGTKSELVGLDREENIGGGKESIVTGKVEEQVNGNLFRTASGGEEQTAESIRIKAKDYAALQGRGVRLEATERLIISVGGQKALEMDRSGSVRIFGKNIVIRGE